MQSLALSPIGDNCPPTPHHDHAPPTGISQVWVRTTADDGEFVNDIQAAWPRRPSALEMMIPANTVGLSSPVHAERHVARPTVEVAIVRSCLEHVR